MFHTSQELIGSLVTRPFFVFSAEEDPMSNLNPGPKDVHVTPSKPVGSKRTRQAIAKVPFSRFHNIMMNTSQHEDEQAPEEEETKKKRTRATATSDTLSGGIPYTSSLRQAVSNLGASHVSSNVTSKTRDTKSLSLSVSSDESVAQVPQDFQVNTM